MVTLKELNSITISEIETYTLNQLQNCSLEELRSIAISDIEKVDNPVLKNYLLSLVEKVVVHVAVDAAKEFFSDLILFLQDLV